MKRNTIALCASLALAGCALEPEPDGNNGQVGYLSGTVDDGYQSNGERGTIQFSEVNWSGSVERVEDGYVWHPDDVFIEFTNKSPRPVHLTNWILRVDFGENLDNIPNAYGDWPRNSSISFRLPERENGLPVQTNEQVVIAARRDGAFAEADYFIEDLRIPNTSFAFTLMDRDERLIDGAGDTRNLPFAGGYDGVTSRSMERVQMIFGARGNRDQSWHAYSYNDFSNSAFHQSLRSEIPENFRERTFSTPGQPNSPDYSGYVSSGNYE